MSALSIPQEWMLAAIADGFLTRVRGGRGSSDRYRTVTSLVRRGFVEGVESQAWLKTRGLWTGKRELCNIISNLRLTDKGMAWNELRLALDATKRLGGHV
jgi:hypothetical protein